MSAAKLTIENNMVYENANEQHTKMVIYYVKSANHVLYRESNYQTAVPAQEAVDNIDHMWIKSDDDLVKVTAVTGMDDAATMTITAGSDDAIKCAESLE